MTTTVGQTFIDRASGVDVSNSIVKVVRFPPSQSELENPFRCASIAPESSARPRKRGYEEFAERVQAELCDTPDISTFIPEQLISSQRVIKRQRNGDLGVNDVGNYLIPIQSSEVFENVVATDMSRTSFIQPSASVQVDDSQRSHGLKRTISNSIPARNRLTRVGRNPYATTNSFRLQSPPGLASFNQRGNVAIPESPTSRGSSLTKSSPLLTIERELGKAKSASPELDSSIHGMSKADDPSKSLDRNDTIDADFKIGDRSPPAVPNSLSPKSDMVHGQSITPKLKGNNRDQAVVPETGASVSKPKFRFESRVETGNINATSSKPRDVFDPIDSAEEKSEDSHNLRRVKRLKSNVSPPSNPPGDHQSPREDVQSGLPVLPQTLKAPKTPPAVSESLGLDGQNRPSPSTNVSKQGSSPARALQETLENSAERLASPFKSYDLSLKSQNEADAASECATIINEQVRSTLTYSLKGDIQRANSVEEVPPISQTVHSRPQKLVAIMVEAPSQEYTGESKENNGADEEKQSSRSKGHEQTSVDQSLGHETKDKQPDELVVVSENNNPESPEDAVRAKRSKTTNPKKEKSTAKRVEEKPKEQKVADDAARQERQATMVRLFNEEEAEAKSQLGKKKFLKATDAKARRSGVHGGKHNDMNASRNRQAVDGRQPKSARSMGSDEARRDEAATKKDMQYAVEGFSGTLTAGERSRKPDALKLVTPKPKVYSDAQTNSSVTSNPRNDAGRARKSMTPAFPGPALIKQTSAESRRSAQTPSRPPTNQDSSLQNDTLGASKTRSQRKATSKAPSALPTSPDLVSATGTLTDRKSHKGAIVNEKDSNIIKIKKKSNPESVLDSSKYSTEKTPKSGKIQTKLNVTRDVKGKGRVDDPPIHSPGQYQEPIIVSSGAEESTSSSGSDEDIHTKSVEAGPSKKRKRLSPAELSNDKVPAKESASDFRAQGSQIAHAANEQKSLAKDPAIKSRSKTAPEAKVAVSPEPLKIRDEKIEESRSKKPREKTIQKEAESHLQAIRSETPIKEPPLPPSSIVDPRVSTTTISPGKSSPRTPAQYMSKLISITSGSESSTDSETDSEMDSDSDGDSDSDSESGSEVESEKNKGARGSLPDRSKSAGPNDTASQQNTTRKTDTELTAPKKASARTMRASSGFTPSAANSNSLVNSSALGILNKKSEREANEQLQREHRQSVGPKLTRASAASSKSTSGEEPKLSHPPNTNGRSIQSNSRPSNYPFLSLTEMKEKRSEKLRSQRTTNGSISKSNLPNLDPNLLDQEEEEDPSESSSNNENDSDDDEDNNTPHLLETAKSRSKSSAKAIKQLLNSKFPEK